MIAAISLTFVFVLGLTSSASAECAWVLWHQAALFNVTSERSDPTSAFHWEAQEAFTSREACRKALLAAEEQLRTASQAELEASRLSSAPLGRMRVFCLPDTVDPRGPKGK